MLVVLFHDAGGAFVQRLCRVEGMAHRIFASFYCCCIAGDTGRSASAGMNSRLLTRLASTLGFGWGTFAWPLRVSRTLSERRVRSVLCRLLG